MQKTNKNSNWQEKYKKRHESNTEILKILQMVADKYPDWRFWQILWNVFIDLNQDRFYEESYDSLEIIKQSIKELYPSIYKEIKDLYND